MLLVLNGSLWGTLLVYLNGLELLLLFEVRHFQTLKLRLVLLMRGE